MTKELIYKEIAERLKVNIETLSDETNFKNDLQADSIDLFEIVMEFEELHGIEISDDTAAEIKTVGDLVEAICV